VGTYGAVRRVIIEVEAALLNENYQWYYNFLEIDPH